MKLLEIGEELRIVTRKCMINGAMLKKGVNLEIPSSNLLGWLSELFVSREMREILGGCKTKCEHNRTHNTLVVLFEFDLEEYDSNKNAKLLEVFIRGAVKAIREVPFELNAEVSFKQRLFEKTREITFEEINRKQSALLSKVLKKVKPTAARKSASAKI